MKIVKSLYLIINYKTFIVTILAVVSTWLCDHFHIVADFPLTLVAIAIVFPVVFSIDSAYKRRERALSLLGDFKAHVIALYHASRDWVGDDKDFQNEIKLELLQIYSRIRDFFVCKPQTAHESERLIYEQISKFSMIAKKFRDHGLQVGEMSRVSQYISKIMVAMENLKVILHYRTPVTLRAYSKVFIYSFPILYGPYFVSVSEHYSEGLQYAMPIVFSFILVSLDNIQGHLENPFDQIGEDDIKFDVEDFSEMMDQ
ncbi:MAG: hypothetical protein RLO81_18755 [Fulvivirga sp.]|uniref:bestrophin family ion channel n=1 Tax=Fulvivirga sp. TaxID=1931237 RepID=UPI0032EFEDDA